MGRPPDTSHFNDQVAEEQPESRLCPLFATHKGDECKVTKIFLNLQHGSFECKSKPKPAHIRLARVSFHSDAEGGNRAIILEFAKQQLSARFGEIKKTKKAS